MLLRALFRVAAVAVPALSFACAGPQVVGPEPTILWEDAPTPSTSSSKTPLSADEARRIAIAHDAGHTCEQTARAMSKKDPQRGWAVMRECVKRNDFSDLEILIEGLWADDMAKDPDAAMMFVSLPIVDHSSVPFDESMITRVRAAVAESPSRIRTL